MMPLFMKVDYRDGVVDGKLNLWVRKSLPTDGYWKGEDSMSRGVSLKQCLLNYAATLPDEVSKPERDEKGHFKKK